MDAAPTTSTLSDQLNDQQRAAATFAPGDLSHRALQARGARMTPGLYQQVKARKQRPAVQAFLDALASEQGRAALEQAGFRPA